MPNSMAAVCIMRANWPSPMTATMGIPGVCAARFPNRSSWTAAASWAAASFWAGLLQVGWMLSVTPYHFRNHGRNWPTPGWDALSYHPCSYFFQSTRSARLCCIWYGRMHPVGFGTLQQRIAAALRLRYDSVMALATMSPTCLAVASVVCVRGPKLERNERA